MQHARARRRRAWRKLAAGPVLVLSGATYLAATPAQAETPQRVASPAVAAAQHAVPLSAAAAAATPSKPAVNSSKPKNKNPKPTGPVGVGGKWALKFGDEFNGSALDPFKWRPNWLGAHNADVTGPFNRLEKSCYDPAQVRVGGGSVQLTAVKKSCRVPSGKTYPYRSGIIQSSDDYWFTYGFAEARMYLPASTDRKLAKPGSCGPNWAAFWVNGAKWPTDGEIDVMECLGSDNVNWHYHGPRGTESKRVADWYGKMPRTKDGWHTFGVDWQPGRMTFYYDGKAVGTVTKDVPRSRHYLIANLSISGTRIKTPQTIKIDYVRVWQRR